MGASLNEMDFRWSSEAQISCNYPEFRLPKVFPAYIQINQLYTSSDIILGAEKHYMIPNVDNTSLTATGLGLCNRLWL